MSTLLRGFFDNFYSFLVRPHSAAVENIKDLSSGSRQVGSTVFVFYISVLVGITIWFFISYPEPLYYGTATSVLRVEVPSIMTDNPFEYLFGLLLATIFVFFLYTYCFWGTIGYFVLGLFSDGRQGTLGKYLGLYAYSLTPLLLWIPVMVIRTFFFERWVQMKPLYPFIDWTAPNTIHQIIIGGCVIWKFVIEVRVNQAFFGVGMWKAMLPAFGQAMLFTAFLIVPSMYNDFFFNSMMHNLV